MIIARLRIHADLSHGSGSSLRRFCCSWKGIRYTYSSFIYTPSRQVKRVDLSIFRRNLISHWNRVVFYNFSLVGSISGTVWWSENRTMEAWLNAVNAVNYYLWSDERSARRSFSTRDVILNRSLIEWWYLMIEFITGERREIERR